MLARPELQPERRPRDAISRYFLAAGAVLVVAAVVLIGLRLGAE